MKHANTLNILTGIYAVLFIFLAINPLDRQTWFVENLTVWIILAVIWFLRSKGITFSTTAYILMFILLYLHTIGGHYTFEKVPFGWVTDTFGFARNHYDRIAHFSVGLYAYGILEWIHRKNMVSRKFILYTYPIFVIATIAMTYELIEWVYAAYSAPEAGAAYLGSQGDIWDAQKDMLADTLGAVVAVIMYVIFPAHKSGASGSTSIDQPAKVRSEE